MTRINYRPLLWISGVVVWIAIVAGSLPGYVLSEVFFVHIHDPVIFYDRLEELLWIILLTVPIACAIQILTAGKTIPVPSDRLAIWGMYAITGIVFILVSIYAKKIWDSVPRIPDSIVYCFQAKIFAAGRLWAPVPDPLNVFDYMFTLVSDGRYISRYSPGFPALLAIGYWLHVPWIISPLFAAATLVIVFHLYDSLYQNRWHALLSVLFFAMSPFFLGVSAQVLTHSSSLFFFASALLMANLAMRSHKTFPAFLSGVCMGSFFIIRQLSAVTLLFPFFIYFLFQWVRCGLHKLWIAVLSGAVLFVLIQGLYNYEFTGNPLRFPFHEGNFGNLDQLGFNQDVKWDVWPEPGQNKPVHTPLKALKNIHLNISQLNRTLWGWPSSLFFFPLALMCGLTKNSRWDWLLLGSLLCMISGYAFYWFTGAGLLGPRYYFEGLISVVFLSLRGLIAATAVLRRHFRGVFVWTPAMFAICSTVHGAYYFWPDHVHLNFEAFAQPFGRLYQRFESQIETPALIFISGDTTTYSLGFFENDIFLKAPIIYARDFGPLKNKNVLSKKSGRKGYLYQPGSLNSHLLKLDSEARYDQGDLSKFKEETIWSDPFNELDKKRWQLKGSSRDCIVAGNGVIHVKGMMHQDMAPGSNADLQYLEIPFVDLSVEAAFRARTSENLNVSLVLENGRFLDESRELAIAALQYWGPECSSDKMPFYVFNSKGFGTTWKGSPRAAFGDEAKRFHRLKLSLDAQKSEVSGFVDGQFLGKSILPYRSSVVKVRLSVFNDGFIERPVDVDWGAFRLFYPESPETTDHHSTLNLAIAEE